MEIYWQMEFKNGVGDWVQDFVYHKTEKRAIQEAKWTGRPKSEVRVVKVTRTVVAGGES